MKLLDTNVCIAVLNGRDRAIARKLKAERDDLVVCSVVKAELYFGARASRKMAENLRALGPLFDMFPSLPFDDAAAAEYGVLRAQLRVAGTPVGPNDLMIAAIALTHNAAVVSRNVAEFTRVPGLVVDAW